MTLPQFLLVGAMKCGTSTLAAQLSAQAGIFVTDPKEPNFFSDDEVYEKGLPYYRSLFAKAGPTDIKGEASTHYTKLPDLPDALPRMKRVLPKVRLVYMIRDPLERLVSHYIHAWSEGLISQPLRKAIKKEHALVDYGRYGFQIQPYVDAYGPESICLTSLERLTQSPEEELARVASHIGFEGATHWLAEDSRHNVSSERARPLPLHRLLIDNPIAQRLRRTFVPKVIRTKIRDLRKMKTRPSIPAAARETLMACYSADRQILVDIFGDDPSLSLAYPFLES